MVVNSISYGTNRNGIIKTVERRVYIKRGKFRNQSFVPDSIEGFRYVQRDIKGFTEMPKSGGPRVREKGKITNRAFLTKAILAIRDKIRRVEMLPNLLVKNRFENFRGNGGLRNRTVVGWLGGVPLLRHRLYERTFPARREG